MYDGGFVFMAPYDANEEYGPLVTLNIEKSRDVISLEQAFEYVKFNLTDGNDLQAKSDTKINVIGQPAFSANITGSIDG